MLIPVVAEYECSIKHPQWLSPYVKLGSENSTLNASTMSASLLFQKYKNVLSITY